MLICVGRYTTVPRCAMAAALVAALGFAGVTLPTSAGWAQVQASSANAVPTLSSQQLDELVGPIALYPDDLLAITLPAPRAAT